MHAVVQQLASPARLLGLIAMSVLVTGATAPTASQAFQCDLPYRASMESLASLKVLKQEAAPSYMALAFGPHTIITLAPGDTRVFSVAPTALKVRLFEPKPSDPERKIKVYFVSTFANTPGNDQAITGANTWHFNVCTGLRTCIREADPAKPAMLEYVHAPDGDLEITCRFEFREDELES